MFIKIIFPTIREIAVPKAAPDGPHIFINGMLIRTLLIAIHKYTTDLTLCRFFAL